MTVIMGLTFIGGAAIASDTMRHNQVTGAAAAPGRKYHLVNPKVAVAKAGYGPDADCIWEILNQSPDIGRAGVDEVVALLQVHGEAVYRDCRDRANALGQPDPGLYFIVAGLLSSGEPALHWLDFSEHNFGGSSGPGKVIAIASRQETNGNATNLAHQALEAEPDGSIAIQIDAWARSVTLAERAHAPHAIDFPTDLVIVRPSNCVEISIAEHPCDPRHEARVKIKIS